MGGSYGQLLVLSGTGCRYRVVAPGALLRVGLWVTWVSGV